MTKSVIISFLVYAIINAFTPGPGNILVLNTATNYGWKKGKRLFFGVFTGYFTVQVIVVNFVYFLGNIAPGVLNILKYVGAAYILWLAIHIIRSKPEFSDKTGQASFLEGFLAQLVNVKIYMFGITSLAGFVTPVSTNYFFMAASELTIVIIGITASITWIGLGMLIKSFYFKHYRVINIVLALTLLECIWGMLF